MQRTLSCLALCLLCAVPAIAADDEPVVYQISEIVEAFESNAAAVDENYANKKLQVAGMVRRVTRAPKSKDDAVEYVVELHANSYGPAAGYSPYAPSAHPDGQKIEFRCSAKERKNLAGLRRGAYVTLEGVCKPGEKDSAVAFAEARLIKVHEVERSSSPIGPVPAYGPTLPAPTPPMAGIPMAVPGFAPAPDFGPPLPR